MRDIFSGYSDFGFSGCSLPGFTSHRLPLLGSESGDDVSRGKTHHAAVPTLLQGYWHLSLSVSLAKPSPRVPDESPNDLLRFQGLKKPGLGCSVGQKTEERCPAWYWSRATVSGLRAEAVSECLRVGCPALLRRRSAVSVSEHLSFWFHDPGTILVSPGCHPCSFAGSQPGVPQPLPPAIPNESRVEDARGESETFCWQR